MTKAKTAAKTAKKTDAPIANLPKFTIKQLLDAGVHFGHKTSRRNTKMCQYLFGVGPHEIVQNICLSSWPQSVTIESRKLIVVVVVKLS